MVISQIAPDSCSLVANSTNGPSKSSANAAIINHQLDQLVFDGHIWVCVKTPGPPWICGSLLFNRVLNGGIERGVLNGELGGVLNGELGGVLNGGHFLNKHPTQPDRS